MKTYTASTLALAVGLLASSPAFAADPILPQADVEQDGSASAGTAASTDPGDDIIVLGTRRTDRTLTNSPSPVDVISAAELNSQPAANMIDQLKNVVPSFYAGQNSISDASTFVRSPSLRGLAGDQVLVMLNGKRYNRSALVQVYGGSDTGLAAAHRDRTSRQSRRLRSATCRCCAKAPPRNTDRTRSPACSTTAYARIRASNWSAVSANSMKATAKVIRSRAMPA